ncbi:tautomerase family protein [Breoghania sp.]|uniref:tautomerase family protein n=1 Tax=Breoghania sp. TaxID=2065378 RepID=UPI0026245ECC|nr:tautomerase family protein [Breoghania sp.]MDJ0931270.1 tautomerase family protein [Breoghania sp.]
MKERRLLVKPRIIKAKNDVYSFLETMLANNSAFNSIIDMDHDHYAIVRGGGMPGFAGHILSQLQQTSEVTMPHISVKHFPKNLDGEARAQLVRSITTTITDAFGCPPNVVSIALEEVAEE